MVKAQKVSRHHAFIVGLLLFVLLLGVGAYLLQHNAKINVLAGEAIRARVSNPVDLGIAPSTLPLKNKENVLQLCPEEVTSAGQGWDLPGWNLLTWKTIDVLCNKNRIICYYGDHDISNPVYYDKKYKDHADHIGFYQDIPGVTKCSVYSYLTTAGGSDSYGCLCEKV